MTYNVLNENPQSKINAIVNGPKQVTPEALDRETSKPMPIGPQDVNVQIPSETTGKPSPAPDSVKAENKKGFWETQKQAIKNGARAYLERKVKEKMGISDPGPDRSQPQSGTTPTAPTIGLPKSSSPTPNTPTPPPTPQRSGPPTPPQRSMPKITKPNFKR